MTGPVVSSLEHLVGPKEDTLNKGWTSGKSSSFGFKMLMKMGWSDGKGLGKDLQGASKHLTVEKRVDTAGLGAVKDNTGNLGWAVASASFDSVLSQLNARYGASTEEKAKKDKKKKRKEEKREKKSKATGSSTMLLRHPKLLRSKDISKYSAHDLSAILGIKKTEAEPPLPTIVVQEEGEEGREERKKRRKEERKRRRVEESEGSGEDKAVVSPECNSAEEEEDAEEQAARLKKEKKRRKKEAKRAAAEQAVEVEEEEEGKKKRKKDKRRKEGRE